MNFKETLFIDRIEIDLWADGLVNIETRVLVPPLGIVEILEQVDENFYLGDESISFVTRKVIQ